MINVLTLDTETTGLEDPIGVVEIAWQLLDEDLLLLSKYDTLVNPEMHIPEDAAAIHGLRDEDVIDAPTLDQVFFPEVPVVLVCHNIRYDRPLVERYLNIAGAVCTMILARRLLPGAENHKLQTLSAYCDLPKVLAHRAPSDVYTVTELLKYITAGCNWTFEQLFDFYEETYVFKTMPLGKFKGQPCSEVPKGYWYWVLGQGDFDKDMIATAKFHLGRK